MNESKTVVAGPFGPVPMAENGRRYIDQEPVTVPLSGQFGSYYVRRIMSGELVEYAPPPQAQSLAKKEGK